MSCYAPKQQTGNDRLTAAILFVWNCRDHVFACTDAAECVKRRAGMRR